LNTTSYSQEDNLTALPPELQGWNWGAFLLNWIWGLGNRCYIGLLVFVPLLGLAIPFVLGVKGNAWAWRNGQWRSVEQFAQTQKRWARYALLAYAVAVVGGVAIVLGVGRGLKRSAAFELAHSRLMSDPQVEQLLGARFETGMVQGSITAHGGGSGDAQFAFPVSGPNGSGKAYVVAREAAGSWILEHLELALADGRRFELVATSPPTTVTPINNDLARMQKSILDRAAAAQQWVHSAVCLVDANGDDVLDVVGATGSGMARGPAVILDGRDGKTLWSGGSYAFASTVFCPTKDTFVLNDYKTFAVSLHSARPPYSEHPVRLSDVPEKWGVGQDCVAIATSDGKTHAFALDGEPRTSCMASMKMTAELHDADWRYGERTSWRARSGTHDYEISVRHPGTPVVSVTARGARNWKVELPYQAEHPIGVLNGSVLVVIAKPLESTERVLRVIGLDAANGRMLYERALCPRNLGITSILANGPNIVLTEGWSGVWNFDAKTGRLLWRSGACG
jgi:hypothetical protein